MGLFTADQGVDSLQVTEIDVDGNSCRGIQSAKASDKLDREFVYGNGSYPVGMPAGTMKATGEIVTIQTEWGGLSKALGSNYTQAPHSLGLNVRRPNGSIYSIILTNVWINEVSTELGKAGGADPSTVTLALAVGDPVDWDGINGLLPAPQSFSFSIQSLGF